MQVFQVFPVAMTSARNTWLFGLISIIWPSNEFIRSTISEGWTCCCWEFVMYENDPNAYWGGSVHTQINERTLCACLCFCVCFFQSVLIYKYCTSALQSLVPKWIVIKSGRVTEVANDLLRIPSTVLICHPGWPSWWSHWEGTYDGPVVNVPVVLIRGRERREGGFLY